MERSCNGQERLETIEPGRSKSFELIVENVYDRVMVLIHVYVSKTKELL